MRSLIIFAVVLAGSSCMLAQNPSVPVQSVSVAPSGACSGSRISYLTPSGTLYTCQSGTWGVSGVLANGKIRSIAVIIDGQGSALVAGVVRYVPVPFACTISAWTITVDTGTVTIDVTKIAAGTALPTVSITAAATPALAANNVLRSTTLTGWTTAVAANDIIGIVLSVSASATNVTFMLECNTP